jgi:2-polyprenyl-6-methoxyphenol hydroxylase-like FAD-dependent oxidoreductase
MRVACVGGGPGGLFLAVLLKRADPSVEVTVFERNRPDDTFGFGVVFSDATLGSIDEADPVLLRGLDERGRHWERIEVRLKGQRISCGGNGMAAITRKLLLQLLQQRAVDAGVELRFGADVSGFAALDDYDVVVAADGANSRIREELSVHLEPEVQVATAKFIWFGTTYLFDGLTFVHERGAHGAFAVHGYPISGDVSTFIVETDEASWRAAGLDEFDVTQPPGASDEKSRRYLESLFAEQIDGHRLLTNSSRWGNFRTRRMRRWHHGNVVFLGDAAHTAHFSVGSGTKMAMEDAAVLARTLLEHRADPDTAFEKYEAERRPAVEHIQNAARPSLSWWEHFGRYHDAFEPAQFAFHFLSRSIGRDKLARRDAGFIAAVEQDWAARHGGNQVLDAPFQAAGHSFPGRLLDSAPDGDWVLRVAAPDDEDGLADAVQCVRAEGRPALVAIHSGTPLTRALLAEEARIGLGLPALVVEPGADADRARTLVLSGRADLVALR